MKSHKSIVLPALAIVALYAFGLTANAQSNHQHVKSGNQQQAQVQVHPGFQTHYTSLGIMSRFISLRAPVQVGGGGGIQTSVAPGYGSGGTWCYSGYQIVSVNHGGVACRAGLEVGDIILMLNGRLMTCQNALNAAVAASQHQRVPCVVLNVRTGVPTTVWCNFSGGGYIQPAQPSYQSNARGNR